MKSLGSQARLEPIWLRIAAINFISLMLVVRSFLKRGREGGAALLASLALGRPRRPSILAPPICKLLWGPLRFPHQIVSSMGPSNDVLCILFCVTVLVPKT